MPYYDAEFRTAAATSERQLFAKTDAAALRTARDIARRVMHASLPLTEIIIRNDGGEVARWQDEDYRLQLLLPRLLPAAYCVVDTWETQQDMAIPLKHLAKVVAIARNKKATVR